MGDHLSPEDVALLVKYCNTVPVDDAIAYINENDCIVEAAWLTQAAAELEKKYTITVMTAYAAAKGELTSVTLTLPPTEPQ